MKSAVNLTRCSSRTFTYVSHSAWLRHCTRCVTLPVRPA